MEEALAEEELADLGFAVGEVEVGLDPHAADDLPTALFDALLDLLVEGGIFFGHPLGVLRGGLREGVVGVLVHELERGGEGALDDVDGFALGPEPGGVDVGVAGEVDFGFREDGVEGGEDLLRVAEGFVEGGLVAGGEGVGVDGGDGFFYFGEEIFARGGESGEEIGGGDALDADVVGRRAGVALVAVGLGSMVRRTPEKVLSSTVWRSLTATRILSPGLAGSKRMMGSRSSPRATRRPLK